MNCKRIWLVMPAALLPYVTLFALSIVFFSTEYPLFGFIMEAVFRNNALILVAAMLVFGLIAGALSVICFFVSIHRRWDALSLAKTAMAIKLIQVPAYIFIFVLGLLLAITVFTFPFTVGLFLFDCLTLFLTGLLNTAAVIISMRQRIVTFREAFWIIVMQFFFCADVVASVVFFLKLRRKSSEAIAG